MLKIPSLRRTLAAGLVLVCSFGASTLKAQDDARIERTLLYSAKFVCKNVSAVDSPEIARAFGPGVYRTVFNLQNIGRAEADLLIRVQEAHSLDIPGPAAHGVVTYALSSGDALYINCRQIQRILGADPDAMAKIDGFVVVESNRRLNAAAVYSAVTRSPDVANDGITLDVEHIRAKVRRRDSSVDEP